MRSPQSQAALCKSALFSHKLPHRFGQQGAGGLARSTMPCHVRTQVQYTTGRTCAVSPIVHEVPLANF